MSDSKQLLIGMTLLQILEAATATRDFQTEFYHETKQVLDDLITMRHGREKIGYFHYNKKIVIPFETASNVVGEYVVFDSCPHYPGIKMSTFDDITDVQNHLVSGASFLNPFTGFSVVLYSGNQLHYEIWFLDSNNKEMKFQKEQQDSFGAEYNAPSIRWIHE